VTAEFVVLQHDARMGPSAFLDVLDARRDLVEWRLVDVEAGQPLPDVESLGGLVVLGSPMTPAADDEPPLATPEELELLRAAVAAEVPVLGVCLGAQQLAIALGGEVQPRERPEVGFVPLWRTESAGDDDVAAGFPDGTPVLFFHRNEVTRLPEGAETVLKGSDGAAAWTCGSALAVQFHPEVTAEQLEAWIAAEGVDELLTAAGVDAEDLLEEARRRERFTVAHGRALLGRFLDGPVRKHVTT
jgi:GMP synthase (glutamine-hydrolysing)